MTKPLIPQIQGSMHVFAYDYNNYNTRFASTGLLKIPTYNT